jgi:hypothetical protein
MNNECRREHLGQERSMNEQWGALDNGELDIADFRGDGGASEFSNYYCDNCGAAFDTWADALAHVTPDQAAGEGRL